MRKIPFLLFIIFLFFSLEGFSQQLTLKIEGENTKATNLINTLGYSKTHKDYISIKSEIDSIQNKLFHLGYIENKVTQIKRVNDTSFNSQIHLKSKFNTVHIYYNKEVIDASFLKLISKNVFKNYFVLNFPEVKIALNLINHEISKRGFPFSKLQLSDIKIKEGLNLEAHLKIDLSERKRTINNITLKGYKKFPRSYLKYFLKIKNNQVFDLNAIKEKTKQLDYLRFSDEIKPPEVLFSKDSTTLYLYLEKSRSNTFNGFLGFGTDDKTSKLKLNGFLNLNLTNNLNFGESFKLLYKNDENDQKTFEANVFLPYLFKTPVGADLLLRIFKKDSSFITTNQSARLHYQINSKHKIHGGIVATESSNLLSKTNTSSSILDYKTQRFTIAYQFVHPQSNNLLSPIKSKLYLETGFGKRKSSLNSEKQSQYAIDALKIFKLNLKNSIFIRVNAANLISNTYFENELLRFGGINSIRGFAENSIFASLYGITNTEYRYLLNNSIFLHSIFDVGYFENKITQTKEKLFSYGFGFSMVTKAGLLRFNYANGKKENTPFKLSNSKIHLSLTTRF